VIRLLALLAISAVAVWGNPQVHSAAPLLNSSAAIQKAREWDRYTIRAGEFSVLLPTAPAMSTYELSPYSREKIRIRHLIGAYSNGVVYAIYVFAGTAPLNDFIATHAPALKGYTRDLHIGKVDGKEFVSQTADYKRIDQYFVSKQQIYLFMAYGSFVGEAAGMSRFFDSIQFESSDNDIAIVDGPGITQSTNELDAAPTFSSKDVTSKPKVITKPEPTYTDQARKEQVIGTVVFKGVLSASGQVTNIELVSGLSAGLSAKALAAVKQLRFVPAIKDGHFVSMYIQIEYNFNLY
jgi:TonB family protein